MSADSDYAASYKGFWSVSGIGEPTGKRS